ncbi:MAG: UDP-N-acetylmuramate dehydrogenase [candidate division WOR-3 bacterium]|nr:UDP-N-acetylmuramate dehydrogenase [candidate division WOR-3 bacterium]
MKNPFRRVSSIKVTTDEPLADHTSFHIGGRARFFVCVYTKTALTMVLQIISKHRLPYFIIGAGTNILVADSGFPGVVLKLGGVFKRIAWRDGLVRCGGGVMIGDFLKESLVEGYGGGEFLAGIPGTVGGAVKGNAGAFGSSIADMAVSAVVVDGNGKEVILSRAELGFSYRSSNINNGCMVITADLVMIRDNRRTIKKKIDENLKRRMERHPVGYSAGSFFKNPPGQAAGKLIEMCGLKGISVGGAVVSEKHANYIINRGGARAADVVALAGHIKKTVFKKTGIRLEEEVKLLG